MILFSKTLVLFVMTAIAEVLGCYLPYMRLRKNYSPCLLFWTAINLFTFFYLLAFHPAVASRIYAAYSGFYIAIAVFWVSQIDGISVSVSDVLSVIVLRVGFAAITLGD